MKNLLRLIGFFFVMALALPAAAQKIYTLEVTAVNSGTAQIKISNVSPPTESNSTINSFKIRAPGAVTAASSVSQSATVTFSGNTVSVKNFNGIKAAPLSPSFITINVSIATCTQGTWYADVYTGNSWNGAKFSQTPQDGTAFGFDCLTLTYLAGANGSLSGATSQVVPRGGSGTPVTATPSGSSYRFAGWSDGSVANPRTDSNVQNNITVTANFALLPKITVTAGANGTITPGTGYVGYGSNNTYTIAPNDKYRIDSVTVDTVAQASPYPTSVPFNNVTSDHSVAATFAKNQLTVTPPTTVYVDQAFNVIVTYDGPAPSSIDLSWTCTPGAASGSKTVPAPVGASPITVPVTLDRAATCTFKVTAPNYFDGIFASTTSSYTGDLGCDADGKKGTLDDPTLIANYVKEASQGKWSLTRGKNKTATPACAVVPYTLEVDVMSSPQTAKFIVPDPTTTNQYVSAKYIIVWGRFDTNANLDNPWTAKRPNMSWGIANPVIGSLDYVPALPCVLDPDSPDLASKYANGFQSVPYDDLPKLMPLIPDTSPFNTISPTDARRGHFSTYQSDGVTRNRAKMCIAQQGWTAVGTDYVDTSVTPNVANPLNVTPTTPSMFQLWTSVIDLADGFMNLQ